MRPGRGLSLSLALVFTGGLFAQETTVSAPLEAAHAKGRNIVWCGAFQLAWNALGQDLCGEPLRLQGTPAMETALNGSRKPDLDPESVFIKAARLSPGLIGEIGASLKKRFGDQAPPPLPPLTGEDGALAYAFLYKNLEFKQPFERRREPMLWRGGEGPEAPLQAFGLLKIDGRTSPELKAQIQILSDRRGSYIIELKTTSVRDRLILAQTAPKATLKETLDDVRERIRSAAAPPFAIQVSDVCLVPCIRVALDRVYDEVIGRAVLNKKLENQILREARQNIRFMLDEKGAVLKAEAKILALKNGHAPRQIVFDRPFLLYLERSGAEQPYLAIWFENPDLFQKSELGDPK